MNKLRILAATLLTALASGLIFSGVAGAQEFRASNNTNVSRDEVIDSSLFIAGSSVNIDGEIHGDVFCAGQSVTVSGHVHGDVLCAGQTVRISGTVDGDVRLAGQTVSISSEIKGNATIGGQSFNLESSGLIKGDATIGSNDASLNGIIGRDLAVGGSRITISSTVGRNIRGSVEDLTLTTTAVVKGNIEYTSKKDFSRAPEAQVIGQVTRHTPVAGTPKRGAVFGFNLMWFLYWFLAMLAIALALALLFPGLLHNITDRAMPRPWKALLTGLVASLAVPVGLVVLSTTFIGIPLAVVLGLLWLVIILVSGPTAGYYLGRNLLTNSKHAVYIMFTGAGLLIILYFIPFIGALVLLLSIWLGSGMILLELMRRTPRPVHAVVSQNELKKSTRKTKKD